MPCLSFSLNLEHASYLYWIRTYQPLLLCNFKSTNAQNLFLYRQGYERVRRNSDEELCLLRSEDMEEGNSHSDPSSSGEHLSKEVKLDI